MHSPIGPTAVASHHSLKYQISKQFTLNTVGIAEASQFLFSHPYTLDHLYSQSSDDKEKWLKQVKDARSYYEEPDDPKIRQLCLQQDYMNNYQLKIAVSPLFLNTITLSLFKTTLLPKSTLLIQCQPIW